MVSYISIKLLSKKGKVRQLRIICYCRKGKIHTMSCYIDMIELNNIRVSNHNNKGDCVRIQLERITLRWQDRGFIIVICFARLWKELVETVTARGIGGSEESLASQSEKPSMSSCPNGTTAETAGRSMRVFPLHRGLPRICLWASVGAWGCCWSVGSSDGKKS